MGFSPAAARPEAGAAAPGPAAAAAAPGKSAAAEAGNRATRELGAGAAAGRADTAWHSTAQHGSARRVAPGCGPGEAGTQLGDTPLRGSGGAGGSALTAPAKSQQVPGPGLGLTLGLGARLFQPCEGCSCPRTRHSQILSPCESTPRRSLIRGRGFRRRGAGVASCKNFSFSTPPSPVPRPCPSVTLRAPRAASPSPCRGLRAGSRQRRGSGLQPPRNPPGPG